MNKEETLMLRELYSSANANQRLLLEKLFPTLKESESEGEWIRKWIIDDIRYNINNESLNNSEYKKQGEKAIAWLEKQGEQKSISNIPSRNVILAIWELGNEWKELTNGCISTEHGTQLNYIQKHWHESDYYLREKQNEQTPVDNVEPKSKPTDEAGPKFKVGDWITFTRKDGTREVLQVSDIIDGRYHFNHLLNGSWSVKECNEKCHLWAIQDAKPGDVLAAHECVVLFKEIDGLNIKCHCTYNFMNNPSFYVNTLQNKNAFHPATKEQCDLLFQKMKEAGYKWENNQLEEINNKGVVDLGLPSGTLWATCNLGAEKETDFGLFYQWGDTQGYSGAEGLQFSWDDYKWGGFDNLTKYNKTDNKLVLDNEDDPVFAATNGMFKMPTKDQLQELIDYTYHEWIENFEGSGVNGMKFVNKNDDTKYIFIPAAGTYNDGSHFGVGSWSGIWSACCNKYGVDYAWNINFSLYYIGMDYCHRCDGFSVRGVINK